MALNVLRLCVGDSIKDYYKKFINNMHLLRKSSMGNFIFISCYIFFKILGLVPGNLRKLNFRYTFYLFGFSWQGHLYNVALMVTYTILSFYSIRALNYSEYPNKSMTTEIFEFLKATCGSISLLILWTVISLKQWRTVMIANEIINMDNAMIKDKNIDGPETCLLRCLLFCGINIFFWINLFWTEMMGFENIQLIVLITEVGPNFVFNWFLILYTLVIALLEMRVQAINHGMLRLLKNLRSLPQTAAHRDKTNSLIALKRAHERLYGIIDEIAASYSFPFFLIITELGASIIYESYYIVTPFLSPSLEFSWLLITNSLCYLFTHTFPIITMTIGVDRISNEMEKTALIVHELYTEIALSREVKSELKLFSLKLLHQKIHFTAFEVFPLNCTLLRSIFGMTVTYLVIIVQFQVL